MSEFSWSRTYTVSPSVVWLVLALWFAAIAVVGVFCVAAVHQNHGLHAAISAALLVTMVHGTKVRFRR